MREYLLGLFRVVDAKMWVLLEMGEVMGLICRGELRGR